MLSITDGERAEDSGMNMRLAYTVKHIQKVTLFDEGVMSAMRKMVMAVLVMPTVLLAATRKDVGIEYADRPECVLDVRVPIGETNFPTVVWFHGGGLTGGNRHFVQLADEKIAQVAVGSRLLGKGACDEGQTLVIRSM